MDERERYMANPLRLLRCALELGKFARRINDEALPYNEINYPPITNAEAPVATEAELL
jgi:hypothetical protein